MKTKQKSNHARYLAVPRGMTPARRLEMAFELTAMTRPLFWAGLRRRFPNLSEAKLQALYVKRQLECSNRSS